MFYDIFDYMSDEEKDALKNSKRVDMSGELSTFPKKTSLAMAYVPWQKWSEPFDSEKSLNEGTMFDDLNMKFERGAK